MNVADSEVVAAVLRRCNYRHTDKPGEADLILVNTCSVREHAEQRVRARLRELGQFKQMHGSVKVGVIGCMAERLKEKLLEEEPVVDLVVGPDAYRELPALLEEVDGGGKGINTLLSTEETYADIAPVRLDKNRVTAFVSIMRGCNNHCAFCVVPSTRGRERSRDPESVTGEVKALIGQGYREVILLGQNVNSYRWNKNGDRVSFEALLEQVARIDPLLRVRFTTSHPKDLSEGLLKQMALYPNICRAIHLPVQSGSTRVLRRMKRRYTREDYMGRVEAIRKHLPDTSLSTDIIAGFSGETEEDHRQTLSLMEWAGFDFSFMFKYSQRPDTFAANRYNDDVPAETKARRLNEIISLQTRLSRKSKEKEVGQIREVLVEGTSKKSETHLFGRTSQNMVVVFQGRDYRPGDYLKVRITGCTSATLFGEHLP
ncbi:MAG TPA: tRNA (N6-isopentenyl adenosine(37)-C2)-methylthiotransferase MiaB [Bacteroides sp.]|nr:tRNA (N6-isopentenyl adenosine(37)-C2)-methylthiotransferase MiaB [Bacteroides sp.]